MLFHLGGCGDWTPASNRCYHVYPRKGVSYADIKAKCRQEGAELARIDDDVQNNAVLKLIRAETPLFLFTGATMIGLHDNQQEGEWKWLDGSSPGYTKWDEEPANDSNDGEHFTYISPSSGKWKTVDCEAATPLHFVCSKNVGGWRLSNHSSLVVCHLDWCACQQRHSQFDSFTFICVHR